MARSGFSTRWSSGGSRVPAFHRAGGRTLPFAATVSYSFGAARLRFQPHRTWEPCQDWLLEITLASTTFEAEAASVGARFTHRAWAIALARLMIPRLPEAIESTAPDPSAPETPMPQASEAPSPGSTVAGIGAFWASWPGVIAFTLLAAVLYGFLDPGFGLDLGSLATFLGMLLGIVLVTAANFVPKSANLLLVEDVTWESVACHHRPRRAPSAERRGRCHTDQTAGWIDTCVMVTDAEWAEWAGGPGSRSEALGTGTVPFGFRRANQIGPAPGKTERLTGSAVVCPTRLASRPARRRSAVIGPIELALRR